MGRWRGILGGVSGAIAADSQSLNLLNGAQTGIGGAFPGLGKTTYAKIPGGWKLASGSGGDLRFVNAELADGSVVNSFGGVASGDVVGYGTKYGGIHKINSIYSARSLIRSAAEP